MRWLTEDLETLERSSLRRSLRVVTETAGPRLSIDGQSLINFSSNNYLGLARHPQVLEAVKQVLEHWGVGATSSRLISGTSVIHGDLESALAAFLSRPAALLFPTGYMANLGVITSLVGPGDAVVIDRLCHASLVDAVRLSGARLLVYSHADLESAEQALKRAQSFRRRLLVTESVFSMDGDFAPWPGLLELAKRYEATSLVDEAHAIGVWGTSGTGLTTGDDGKQRVTRDTAGHAKTAGEENTAENPSSQASPAVTPITRSTSRHPSSPSSPAFDVIVGTLSKSLGSQGGFVAGSHDLIDTLINKARSFIFTTGLSPACVAAAQAALSLIQENPVPRNHVQSLSLKLREGLRGLGFDILKSESQIVPIVLGEAKTALELADHLRENGIFAPAIRPPTVHAGECRLRFSVTSEHQDADIEKLIQTLKESKK